MTTQPLSSHCDSRQGFKQQEQGVSSTHPGGKAAAGRIKGHSWFFLVSPPELLSRRFEDPHMVRERKGRWLVNGHWCPDLKSKDKKEFLFFLHDPSQVPNAGKQLGMQKMPGIWACFYHPGSCQETDSTVPWGKWEEFNEELSVRARARHRRPESKARGPEWLMQSFTNMSTCKDLATRTFITALLVKAKIWKWPAC